ncbi:MAG: amidohydrolase family protein [Myxococcota bacterium]|nr:amidohydrolase family protein [Myxococcales bacterium]
MGEGRIVFRNANLLDGENAAVPGSTVVVDGKRIASVGTGPVATGADDRVIDLGGKSLMPGMVNAHFHSGFGPAPSLTQPPILGLDAPLPYMGMIAARNAGIALDAGVTSVIGSSNPGHLDVCLKDAMTIGIVEGPRILACTHEFMASGDMADGTNRSWYMEVGAQGLIRRVNGVEEMRAAVREEVGRGCGVVKLSVSPGHGSAPAREISYYTQPELDVAVSTAAELGAIVRAHCASAKGIKMCAKAGLRIIDHADKIDDEGIEAVLRADAAVTPSMLWSVRFLQFAESWDHSQATFPIGEGFPEPLDRVLERLAGVRRDFEYTCKMVPLMEKAGVRLLVGDDFGYPMMPHGDYVSEYEVYTQQLGIPALSVLRWATKNGAEAMGMGDELGTVRAGRLADLLVVDGDPSKDIGVLRTGIRLVMKDGKVVRDRMAG